MPHRLTAEVENQIVQFIRAGAFDWVAAEAAGVPRAVFERWLLLGDRPGRLPYRRFLQNVMQARAQARVAAEVKAREQDARFWLKHGPGRERPGRPGWTNPARLVRRPADDGVNPLDSAEVRALLAELVRAADQGSDVRDVLAERLRRGDHARS